MRLLGTTLVCYLVGVCAMQEEKESGRERAPPTEIPPPQAPKGFVWKLVPAEEAAAPLEKQAQEAVAGPPPKAIRDQPVHQPPPVTATPTQAESAKAAEPPPAGPVQSHQSDREEDL